MREVVLVLRLLSHLPRHLRSLMQSRLVSGTLAAALLAASAWGWVAAVVVAARRPPRPAASPPPPATTTVTVSVVGSSGNTAFQPNPVRAVHR